MLNKQLRNQIEGHFRNYKFSSKLFDDALSESPTGSKSIDIFDHEKSWVTVVLNTYIAFRFEPVYDVMLGLYVNDAQHKDLYNDDTQKRAFYRKRDKWLEYAYKWAKELELI